MRFGIGVENIFADPGLPAPSDSVEVGVETRHGWLFPPEWEFITEEWVCTRKPAVDSDRCQHTCDYSSEAGIIR